MLHMGMVAAGTLPSKLDAEKSESYWHNNPEARAQTAKQAREKSLSGIRLYQLHPYMRPVMDEPVWQDGEATIRFYAARKNKKYLGRIFIVPSMINDTAILDIMPEPDGRSFVRWLAGEGYDVFVFDWGNLKKDPELKTLDKAVGVKLARAVKWLTNKSSAKLHGIGYCMGGLLLLGLYARSPQAFQTLSLIATPWDFHAGRAGMDHVVRQWSQQGIAGLRPQDYVAADWIQAMFAGMDPSMIVRKFSAFAAMHQKTQDAKLFVAVEDWLSSGVDMPQPIARACFEDWYINNLTMKKKWKVSGRIVDPSKMDVRSLVIAPKRDKLVNPASAEKLAHILTKADLLQPDCGHISMMVSENAEKLVWKPLLKWLKRADSNVAPQQRKKRPRSRRKA